MTSSIVIVGAGPRGTGVLERLVANVPAVLGDRELRIHLVDPYPPGAGRIWRYAQSPLLKMNSMADDVAMYTDDSVAVEGPIRPGPTLREWVAVARPEGDTDPGIAAEAAELTGATFASRRLQSRYLEWVFAQAVAAAPPSVRVSVYPTEVTEVTGPRDGPQCVALADGTRIAADLVIFTLGHLDADPDSEHERLRDFAGRYGLTYLPPAYTSDTDLDRLPAGENVIVRGFGLAFVDLMVLLTEGRGGTVRTATDGTMTYLPSGREPILYVGSRRGVPYHSKLGYQLSGARPPLPMFFGPAAVRELVARPGRLRLRPDVWPLMAKEIGWGYYHELGAAHPSRMRLSWAEFAHRYAELDWYSGGMRELVGSAVPDPADRLDFEALDHPLRGRTFGTPAALQEYIRRYVREDIDRHQNPSYSADLGAFVALLSVFGQLVPLLAAGKLTGDSYLSDVDGWWRGFFSFLASGPPPYRLELLLALSRAGIVNFLGAGTLVRADPDSGLFLAGSASTGAVVSARVLLEGRQPAADLGRTRSALLRTLAGRGEVTEAVLDDVAPARRTGLVRVAGDGRLIDRDEVPHPRRFALGPFTDGLAFAAFARPNTNALPLRQNDAAARAALAVLLGGAPVSTAGPGCG